MNVLLRFLLIFPILLVVSPITSATPWEVLSDVSYIRKGGVNAIRVDFAFPIYYETHFPVKHGKSLTINIRFRKSADIQKGSGQEGGSDDNVIDISELPLLQTIQAPDSLLMPLRQVTYFSEDNEPKVLLEFNEDVEFNVSQIMGVTSLMIFLPQVINPDEIDPEILPADKDLARDKRVVEKISAPIVTTPGVTTPIVTTPIETTPVVPVPVVVEEAGSTGEASEETEVAEGREVSLYDEVNEVGMQKISAAEKDKIKQILDKGRATLKNGNNKYAVQIFTKLVSMPEHPYSKISLELLGVSRERNNQIAQAKLVYKQYLKKYPKGDGANRVNQRLADLLASRNKPKKPLKTTKDRDAEKKDYSSNYYGSLSQYFDYGATETDVTERSTDQRNYNTLFTLSHRYRSKDLDVRSYIRANHDYDSIDRESDGIEIGTLYSKIRHSTLGINSIIGRQSPSTAGTLSKFDGITLGFRARENIRVNGVYGFHYDSSDKQHIQTNRPFFGASVEFNNYIKDWDFSPYIFQHTSDGVTDRSAIGAEVRYFDKKLSVFGQLDYDYYFGETNWLLFNGSYLWKDSTSISLLLEDRKNPSLETSNALIQLFGDNVSLDSIKNDYGKTEEELKSIALDRTGFSQTFQVGISHRYTDKISFTGNIAYNKFLSKIVNTNPNAVDPDLDTLGRDSTSNVDTQWNYSFQAILTDILDPRDTVIGYLRLVDSSDYGEISYSAGYRVPFDKYWRIQYKLSLRDRDNNSGQDVVRIIPSIKLDNRFNRNLEIFLEAFVENSFYSDIGVAGQPDATSFNLFMGYVWAFEKGK